VEGIPLQEPSITTKHNPQALLPEHRERLLMKNSLFRIVAARRRFALPTIATLLLALSPGQAEPGNDQRAPSVPTNLVVTAEHKVSFHAFAAGVQIYTATASAASGTGFVWTFTAPEAVLFDFDGNVVGRHYAFAGPTRPAWESASGSRVVGARTVAPVTVEPSAIPWLVLNAVPESTTGPGIFERTTHIQRVNTTGGLAPASAPTQLGVEARVPYTAEYYFYRKQN
jgi:hypothetical protein